MRPAQLLIQGCVELRNASPVGMETGKNGYFQEVTISFCF